MQIFYAPDIESTLVLPEEESGHCVRVMRLAEGDEIMITDGKGNFYRASITNAHPKHCQVEITSSWQPEKPWDAYIHIAVAPTKNMDRMEWFAEKATEIGIDEIKCHEAVAKSFIAPIKRDDRFQTVCPATFQREEIHSPLRGRRKAFDQIHLSSWRECLNIDWSGRRLQSRRDKISRREWLRSYFFGEKQVTHGNGCTDGLSHHPCIEPIIITYFKYQPVRIPAISPGLHRKG